MNYKDLNKIVLNGNYTNRNIFNIFFKSLMTFTDINDIALYIMQLKLIQGRKIMLNLKNNTMDFYFF